MGSQGVDAASGNWRLIRRNPTQVLCFADVLLASARGSAAACTISGLAYSPIGSLRYDGTTWIDARIKKRDAISN